MVKKYELLLAEKPTSAKKIAEALADKTPAKQINQKIAYYTLTHKGKDIVVVCAVGHLYGLTEKEKNGWKYPTFSFEWKPIHELQKNAKYTKAYIATIKKLAKESKEFTVCTDFDDEGSVLGINAIKYACGKKDAHRMKFSTLTKADLIESYEHKMKTMDWGQVNAGITRHELDWMYGINNSRALTLAIKTAGTFQILSTGRVQGPALKIIVDKDREIAKFKPVLFWQLELQGKHGITLISAWHKEGKLWEKEKAETILKKTKNKKAVVANLQKKEVTQAPPFPFDLTTLQTEAYRCFGISPKETMSLTQGLYVNGYISYPRSSSNKLPPALNYKKIIANLGKQEEYETACNLLLQKKKLLPNEGLKSDPAHPAVHATGEVPKKLNEREAKMYDLIVRRTLATFGDPAKNETLTVTINVNKEPFIAKGSVNIVPGWYVFYGKYVSRKDEVLPVMNVGDEIKNPKIIMHADETKPPKRYTPASIIKEMEKKNLGTKCLTEDNLVTVKSDVPRSVRISELFEKSLKTNITYDNAAIRINKHHDCISLMNGKMEESNYKLVSRRKLEEGEKVFKLIFNDSSILKATEGHPVLCWKNKLVAYERLQNLKKGDQVVAFHSNIDKRGQIIFTWENFIKLTGKKTKIYGCYNLKNKRNVSQYDLADQLGVKQPIISAWESKKQVPIWVFNKIKENPDHLVGIAKYKIKNPFPLKMSSSLARVLANLVGDGSIDREKIKKENCFDFRYHNQNTMLLKRFIQDINNIFGVKLTIKENKSKNTPFIRIPAMIGRILFLIAPEILEKNISKMIPKIFYPETIGALFDDEGHTTKDESKIFISGTKFDMLYKLKVFLKELGIVSVLSKKQFKLYIYGRENLALFLQKIPIISLEKKKRLLNHLHRFYKYGTEKSRFVKEKEILSVFDHKKLTSKELAKKISKTQPTVRYYLSSLMSKGFIQKEVVGISKQPRKKILYSVKKEMQGTYYSLIGEKLINEYLCTKTVKSNNPVDYAGYVYDITNNEKAPNFMLSNRVIVHNSTRANIIDTLYNRNYINDKSIQATKLGLATVETLEKFCPEILDEQLTRHFEEETEMVRAGTKKNEEIIKEAETSLTKVLSHFKKNEKKIGEGLLKATQETRTEINTIALCRFCKKGNWIIRYSPRFKSRFVGCSAYPKCKATFGLPQGLPKPSKRVCRECAFPQVTIIRQGKRPFEYCINKECKLKEEWVKQQQEKMANKESENVSKGKSTVRYRK